MEFALTLIVGLAFGAVAGWHAREAAGDDPDHDSRGDNPSKDE